MCKAISSTVFLTLLMVSPLLLCAAEEKTLLLPPESLAQWYKPQNKRQVWLHTMFRLRREIQAIQEYAELEDKDLITKWVKRLTKDYRSLIEMVPEWRDEVDLELTDQLLQAVQQDNFSGVKQTTRRLEQTCKSCHREYRALVAARFRTPNYKAIQISQQDGHTLVFPEVMKQLSSAVNRIIIASEDNRWPVAAESFTSLKSLLADLGTSCSVCHSEDPTPKLRILGESSRQILRDLETSIQTQDLKKSGKHLGTAAVVICARCHGVHRTLWDLVQTVMPNNPD